MSSTVTKYQRTETVRTTVYTYNLSGTLVDISSNPVITIVDPRGVKVVDETSMTKSATGTYVYSWTSTSTSALGRYVITTVGTDSSASIVNKNEFDLEASFGE